jgi:hypothetical protein
MLTVIETPADPNANSYVTLLEANAYMETRLHSDVWATFSDDQKNASIISATSWLDACFRWTGTPTTTTQVLGWPRTGMFTRNEVPIDPMALPFDLKKATSEFAISLATAQRTADNDAANQGISEMKAGPVSLKFADVKGNITDIVLADAEIIRNGPDFAYLSRIIPDAVRALIPPSWYLRATLGTAEGGMAGSFIFMATR